jgi:tRNA A37 threonylcarbamoyladenosine dehydratase
LLQLSDREFALYRSVQEEIQKLNDVKRRKLEDQLARMLREQQIQNQALISHVFSTDKPKNSRKDEEICVKNEQEIIVIEVLLSI